MRKKKEFPTQQMKNFLREKIVRGSGLKKEKIKIEFQFWTVGNVETLYSYRQDYESCLKNFAKVASNTEARYELGKVQYNFQNGVSVYEIIRIDLELEKVA